MKLPKKDKEKNPVKLNMTFEESMKKALSTPIKAGKSKKTKKGK